MKLLLIFVFIGGLFGIAMGIPLGRLFCALIVQSRNSTSKGKKVHFRYSTRGIEIVNRTEDDLDVPPLSFGKKKDYNPSEAKEYKEALDYFKRNMI